MNARWRMALAAWFATTCLAAQPEADKVRLSPHDQRQIGTVACKATGSSGAEQVDARQAGQGGGIIEAFVSCLPHGVQDSAPVVHRTSCDNRKGTWTCVEGYDAFMVRLPDASTVAVVADGVEARTAVELVREAADVTVPPFHTPARWLLKDECRVGARSGPEIKGGAHYRIACTPGDILLTRDCWNRKCRIYSVGGAQRKE